MAAREAHVPEGFIPWGEDAHRSVREFLQWPENSSLGCCSRAFHAAVIEGNRHGGVWWKQAQSTSRDVESLMASLSQAVQVLTPSSRPNMAMLMIDSEVLLTTTVRDLCGRLHSVNLVPFECPIVVVESSAGVFGAGVTGEGNFSVYEGRDIELDPCAPVTAVLTVVHIPPEERKHDGGTNPRVKCFLVDDQPENRRDGRKLAVDGVPAVLMECVSPPSFTTSTCPSARKSPSAATPKDGSEGRGHKSTDAPNSVETAAAATATGDAAAATPKKEEQAQPLRRSQRASTVASSKAAIGGSRMLHGLSSPSPDVPVEDADTMFLIGNHPRILSQTSAWLEKMLPNAVILGGISNTSLVVGDKVFPDDKLRRSAPRGFVQPVVVGVALRGVHAMAISAKGVEGVGRTFRVDATVSTDDGALLAKSGKYLREVVVTAEEGAGGLVPSLAQTILAEEVEQHRGQALHIGPDGNYNMEASETLDVTLGVASSPEELSDERQVATMDGDVEGMEEASGLPPIDLAGVIGRVVVLTDDVSPGQYGRYMVASPTRVLSDTEYSYRCCKRRVEREGSVVLSSIHFTCSVRPDRVETPRQQEQQEQDGHVPVGHEEAGAGAVGEDSTTCVMSLQQQEMVRFCSTLHAPAAGVFCEGELGPAATRMSGILPRTAEARMQSFTSCSAVLCWQPNERGHQEK